MFEFSLTVLFRLRERFSGGFLRFSNFQKIFLVVQLWIGFDWFNSKVYVQINRMILLERSSEATNPLIQPFIRIERPEHHLDEIY